MPSLTIKKLDPHVLQRLTQQARKRGQSLNSYLKDQLAALAGWRPGIKTFHDLSHLAGSWSEKDEMEFRQAIEPLERIDEDLWR